MTSSADSPTIPPNPGALQRFAELPPSSVLTAAGAIFVILSLVGIQGASPTFDEGAHLVAGFTYWTRGDFRMNPEHPPLAKLLSAAPLLVQDIRWPSDSTAWGRGDIQEFSYRLLYQSGNAPERLLLSARAIMLLWGLLFVAAVYLVTRDIFGKVPALLALVVTVFFPTVVAHAPLVTTDVPLAALSLVTVAAFRNWLQKPTVTRSLIVGGLLGAALATKFSAVLLIPALGWMAIVFHSLRREPGDGAVRKNTISSSRHRLRRLGACLLVAALAWGVLWATYGFRFKASPDPRFELQWNFEATQFSATHRLLHFARDKRLLPEAYLHGFAFVNEHAQRRSAFALGRYSDTGWWWYFPFAFLVKTPASTLLLFGAGLCGMIARFRRRSFDEFFLLIPPTVFGVFSLGTHLNIGERHLLPCYPFLLVMVGAIDIQALSAPARRGVAALGVLVVFECLSSAPYFLTHFNLISRCLWARHEMLVDSNLDWGQDLGRLKRYMDAAGIPEIKLAYFGTASPARLGLKHQMLPSFNWYARYEPGWDAAEPLRSGDWVAVSATSLVGVYSSDREWFPKTFRGLKPVAEIGHSILVYRIP